MASRVRGEKDTGVLFKTGHFWGAFTMSSVPRSRRQERIRRRAQDPELPTAPALIRKSIQLSDEDQKTLVVVLDSLVKRSPVSQVMAEL
jgi:hypothetical protein